MAMWPIVALAHGDGHVTPDTLWSSWSLPVAPALAMLAVAALYTVGTVRIASHRREGAGNMTWPVAAFAGGMLALVVAILSPLDPLGDALLAAHMTQHVLLLAVAPPLLVLGRPIVALLVALPRGWRAGISRGWHRAGAVRAAWRFLEHPVVSWVVAAVILWGWHAPALYEAAIRHPLLHDLEHAMFLGSALLFWWSVLQPMERRARNYGTAVIAIFTTALQGGALGVLMIFASAPWYPIYEDRGAPWHLSLMEDQHLAGAIMWVPVSVLYLIAILGLMYAWLRGADDALPPVRRRSQSGPLDLHQQEGAESWVQS